MAQSTTAAPTRTLFDIFADFFTLVTESNWRVREAERLHAMTDAELAARGIRREEIARHVFRDLTYI